MAKKSLEFNRSAVGNCSFCEERAICEVFTRQDYDYAAIEPWLTLCFRACQEHTKLLAEKLNQTIAPKKTPEEIITDWSHVDWQHRSFHSPVSPIEEEKI
jgi:hypothetical protein